MSDDYKILKSSVLSELSTTVDQNVKFASDLSLDREDKQFQYVAGTFLSIIEVCHAIGILIKADKLHDASILLRAEFELLVKLCAYCRETDFVERGELEYLSNYLRKLEAAKGGNKYLGRLASMPELDSQITGLKTEIAQMRSKGVKKPYTFADLCARMGFSDEYQAIYPSLSKMPHGGFESILKRNIEIDYVKNEHCFSLFAEPTAIDLDAYVGSAVSWLSYARQVFDQYLEDTPRDK